MKVYICVISHPEAGVVAAVGASNPDKALELAVAQAQKAGAALQLDGNFELLDGEEYEVEHFTNDFE